MDKRTIPAVYRYKFKEDLQWQYTESAAQAHRLAVIEPLYTAAPDSLLELLADLRWRINDIRDDLIRSRGDCGSIYGIDEWSVPAVNLQLALAKIDSALAP